MTELYLGVMDAIWNMTAGAPIFFINGGGQGNYSGLNWCVHACMAAALGTASMCTRSRASRATHPARRGNGFVTDKGIIDEFLIDDANPFFKALMKKPYLDKVVISPHICECSPAAAA